MTNHRSVFKSREKCCPIRGKYCYLSLYQDHITAENNNQDVMDSSKFVPIAVTSNPVAKNEASSVKQKVGGKLKQDKVFLGSVCFTKYKKRAKKI